MKEYLNLSDRTDTFIKENGIGVVEESRIDCYKLVTDTLKNVLYVIFLKVVNN